jgi:D-glycero-D-manno-heptose 1,7-bisphosphate phosphatase
MIQNKNSPKTPKTASSHPVQIGGSAIRDILHRRHALFLDRDGIINIDNNYVYRQQDFTFTPGIFLFLRAVQDLGYRLAILTNQSGVARGFYTVTDYQGITSYMLSILAKEGISIDLVLACFEHEDGSVANYARESFWRKPNPGMVMDAAQRLRVDPARSAFLGDRLSDMDAAKAGGIGLPLWLTSDTAQRHSINVHTIKNFDEALEELTVFKNNHADII